MPRQSARCELLTYLQQECAFALIVEDDDELLDDLSEAYHLSLCNRYVQDRTATPKRHDYVLNFLFSQTETMFKQHVRTTQNGFRNLVALREPHPIFHNNNRSPQVNVAYQTAVCLMRLGSYGNGAALQNIQRIFGIGKGTVVLYMERVIKALFSMRSNWVVWPDRARRKEISAVLKKEGFPGCLGFVDGTTVPLHQKPAEDGQAYFDRKHKYSISFQFFCNSDKRVTAYQTGWPGSAHDATVYKDCDLYEAPAKYFGPGEYLLADASYACSSTVVPCYKSPAALVQENAEFNHFLPHSRVRNEHCIGVLKGRLSSLREIRRPLNGITDMKHIRNWMTDVHCSAQHSRALGGGLGGSL